jgi:hypothetical protein
MKIAKNIDMQGSLPGQKSSNYVSSVCLSLIVLNAAFYLALFSYLCYTSVGIAN